MSRLFALFTVMLVATPSFADEIGHYSPGVASIRDLAVPAPGLYGALYNHFYHSKRLNDGSGNEVRSVEVGRREPTTTVGVEIDLKLYALAPVLAWVSEQKIFGAKFATYIAPSFANASAGAVLSTVSGRGGEASSSTFNVADLMVQPIWLGWGLKHWDVALGYGFYAPTGSYDTETVELPVIGALRFESSDNIGLGFWTQQLQGAVTWYPWEDQRLAVNSALTYEFHSEKEDFDLTPGQDLSLNWGASQYLPLVKDQTLLAEIGVTGYDTWQTTDDRGRDASGAAHDQVHAVGGQLGLTYLPWSVLLNVHAFYEFAARDRLQGNTFGVNLAQKF